MGRDMQEVFSETKAALEKTIEDTDLTREQKELVKKAMEFGYSAAFCESRHDMQGSFHAAQEYRTGYETVKELLE